MKPHDYKVAEEILRSASANIDVPLDKWPHYAVENLFHLAHDLFAKVKQQDAENADLRRALEKIAKGFGGPGLIAPVAENAYREKVARKALERKALPQGNKNE